jgi:hypothetical protein
MTLLSHEHPAAPQDPVIRGYLDQLEAVLLDARSLAGDLTPEQFNWRPEGRRWSVGQCLEHLTLTLQRYMPLLEPAAVEARVRFDRGEAPYREGWFAGWFVGNMEPPPSMRVRTFSVVEPASGLDRDTVLDTFEAAHGRLGDLLGRAEGAHLKHGRAASPFASWLKFTLAQAIAINLAHARRHLWQARQVLGHPAFPN